MLIKTLNSTPDQTNNLVQFEQGRTFLNLAGQASWPRAVEHFRAAADSGHAVATAWLAHCHWYGQGVAKNLTVAQQLAHQIKAVLLADADHGDASAQTALGSMYRDGLGCVSDQHGAVAWFRKAAEQGDLEAQICLSVAYRDGHGVEQDDREAAVWLRKAAEQEDIEAQYSLGEAYLAGEGVAREECTAMAWFRKAAGQGHEGAQHTLEDWDTTLAGVAMDWKVVYAPVVQVDVELAERRWVRGACGEVERVEAYESESQEEEGMLQRMSPWVMQCKLDWDTLEAKAIQMDEVRGMAEEACRECGCSASVVTSAHAKYDGDVDVSWTTLRVRLLATGSHTHGGPIGLAVQHEADGGGGGNPTAQPQEARELTVCCPDGTSHKLVVSLSTTVLEVKQHLRRVVRAAHADAEDNARPFWQDEHAVQRQHVFVQGVEDELADARSMGSLGSPSALFLMVDTETSFMGRLEAAAAALRPRLEGVKLRDLVRCEAEAAAAAAAAAAALGSATEGGDGSRPPSKKAKLN
jgi:hypothetical protein